MRRLLSFSVLLAGMFAELMLSPIFLSPPLSGAPGAVGVARMVTAGMLMAAVSVVGAGRVTLALFVPALLAHIASGYSAAPTVTAAAVATRLVFLCHVTAAVVRHVMGAVRVTSDTIAGAACAYMLLGMVWASLFHVVELVHPGSFDIPTGWRTAPGDSQPALTYFSFVTLATVGYGDVKPMNLGAGGLCVAEALVGQLYLATMIARLVGLEVAQRSH